MESYGYMVNAGLFNTADFGPGQSRHRAWVIAGLGCNTAEAIKDVASLRCQTWPLSTCVKPELKLGSIVEQGRKQKEGSKWKKDFEKLCKDHGGKVGSSGIE